MCSHDFAAAERASTIQRARALVLFGAFLSFAFSVTLWFTGSRDEGLFVGLWVPSILAAGALALPRDR